MKTDTIAAIASGLTHAGIGIIRISGECAIEITDRIFRMKDKKLKDQKSHTVHYGFIYDEEVQLDEVIVVLMRGPKSFTAEDVVEIQCHGGPWIMKRILEAVIKNGARIAEPGEFTKRAFLNGRIDLSQAEAVMSLIQSQNNFAQKASMDQLKGNVSGKIKELREKILYEIAFIEAALDDPEHISLDGYSDKLMDILNPIIEQVAELIRTADNGKMLSEGIKTVILGKPNAGKSSLLNQLVGEDRAIVTDIEGTTRDVLEETIRLNGISLRLIDTAGIRDTDDKIEQIGVEKAKEQAHKADLIIYVVDSSKQLDENDKQIMEILKGKKSLILMNKIDLTANITSDELEKLTDCPVICISAKEGTGISQLEKAIEDMFDVGSIGKEQQITITNVRHKTALMEAEESLLMVRESMEMGMTEDLFTIDLMNAYEALGRIIGESVEDDLVNEIFSKFCMGK
ncbi:MAG: tRNA uridine-5-carboxymethylaminomethyl(34) synthesis GTPase MnmE [Clostridiales bacterium]|nr:tRNA uridine-5-carboxymethylaminomethyl(34) synthesis GTPase MnmE [Clostridiales bacterium]